MLRVRPLNNENIKFCRWNYETSNCERNLKEMLSGEKQNKNREIKREEKQNKNKIKKSPKVMQKGEVYTQLKGGKGEVIDKRKKEKKKYRHVEA